MTVADAALGTMIVSPSMMVGPVVSLVPMQKSTCYDERKHTNAAAVAAEGTEELVRLHANDLDLAVVVFLARSWNVRRWTAIGQLIDWVIYRGVQASAWRSHRGLSLERELGQLKRMRT